MGTTSPCPMGVTLDNLPIQGFRVKMHKINPDGSRCAPCKPVAVTFRSASPALPAK